MFIETLFLLGSANAQCANCSLVDVAAVPVTVSAIDLVTVNVAKPIAIVPSGQVEVEYKRNLFGKLVPVRAVQTIQKKSTGKASKSGASCKSCNK